MEPSSKIAAKLLAGEKLCVVDVGAADGLAKRWRPIAEALRVVAFEADARSGVGAELSKAEVDVIPRAASIKEGPATLYLTRKPRCSSLLEPNRAVIERYPDPQRYDVLQTPVVECSTIDAELGKLGLDMDFLKIDTQGTELDVLRGGEHCLSRCLGLEIEVEFQQLYVGASVFRDIDAYVSGFGFELFDLRRTFFARGAQENGSQKKGQIAFGDALYFRPWRTIAERDRLLKLAILMLTYGLGDVVVEIIEGSQVLTEQDQRSLRQMVRRLAQVADNPDRKDRFLGSGLYLR
jgi:FkbM family methyltransferase